MTEKNNQDHLETTPMPIVNDQPITEIIDVASATTSDTDTVVIEAKSLNTATSDATTTPSEPVATETKAFPTSMSAAGVGTEDSAPSAGPNQASQQWYGQAPQHTPPTAAHRPSPAPHPVAAPQVAPQPIADPAQAGGPRASTIIWGVIILLLGVALLLGVLGFTLDLQLFTIVLFGVAGVALVASAIGKSLKR